LASLRWRERRGYEAAARCLADDLDALVVRLRYPLRHRQRWRSANLLDRSLGAVCRRTKVIGRFPGETSCLSLVWAVLDLFFSHASNGASFTDVDRRRPVPHRRRRIRIDRSRISIMSPALWVSLSGESGSVSITVTQFSPSWGVTVNWSGS
jgi:hypothetical protein